VQTVGRSASLVSLAAFRTFPKIRHAPRCMHNAFHPMGIRCPSSEHRVYLSVHTPDPSPLRREAVAPVHRPQRRHLAVLKHGVIFHIVYVATKSRLAKNLEFVVGLRKWTAVCSGKEEPSSRSRTTRRPSSSDNGRRDRTRTLIIWLSRRSRCTSPSC
jgi:hypothetical protein